MLAASLMSSGPSLEPMLYREVSKLLILIHTRGCDCRQDLTRDRVSKEFVFGTLCVVFFLQ